MPDFYPNSALFYASCAKTGLANVAKSSFWSIITAVVLGIISVLLFFYGGSSFTESGVLFDYYRPNSSFGRGRGCL